MINLLLRSLLYTLTLGLAIESGAQLKTNDLVVHEWGTFTAVQGSNGQPQGGMHHEEESLPSFVHSRDVMGERSRVVSIPRNNFCKGFPCDEFGPVTPAPVRLVATQKMETPIIYFHSTEPQRVQVVVDFPQGIISQYYPAPKSFAPGLGMINGLRGGRIDYEIELLFGPPKNLPEVDPANVYAPARNVKANFIRSEGENEQFIFYRGLGNFRTDLVVRSSRNALTFGRADNNLEIVNTGFNDIAAVFLVDVRANGDGSFINLGALRQGEVVQNATERLAHVVGHALPRDEFLRTVSANLTKQLVASGLFVDEAEAMTNTWKRSYFRTPGLRVLYVLSRQETDRLLPIQVQPTPQELVRTMVGRIEVFLATEEELVLQQIQTQGSNFNVSLLGRFAEPRLHRVRQLTTSSDVMSTIDTLISRL